MVTRHSQCVWELRDSHMFEEPGKCSMFLFPPGNGSSQVQVFLLEACVSTPPGRFILYFAFFKCTKYPQAALMFGSLRSRVGHSDEELRQVTRHLRITLAYSYNSFQAWLQVRMYSSGVFYNCRLLIPFQTHSVRILGGGSRNLQGVSTPPHLPGS